MSSASSCEMPSTVHRSSTLARATPRAPPKRCSSRARFFGPTPGISSSELAPVRTLARRLFVDERAAVPVALAGGLLARGSGVLRKRTEQRLKTAVPGAQLRQDPVEPARGAVRGALKLLGVEIT